MDTYKLKKINNLLDELNMTHMKESLVNSYSNGQTSELAEMKTPDGNKLWSSLLDKRKESRNKMIRKITHMLCVYGMTINDKPDYLRQDQFIRSIGSNNPKGLSLKFLKYPEIYNICNQVDAMVKKSMSKQKDGHRSVV